MSTKKIKKSNNQTKKCRPTQKEMAIMCREHANTFNKFEEDFEKGFKKSLGKDLATLNLGGWTQGLA